MHLTQVLSMLDQKPWSVFRRMRLHLLRVFPEQAGALIAEAIMDRKLFEDNHVRHEYALLVRDHFGSLRAEQKARWLSWVEEGPKNRAYLSSERGMRTEQIEGWQDTRLLWIEEELRSLRPDLAKRLRKDEDMPERPFFPVYGGGGWVRSMDESPYSADELADMDFPEAVRRVREWKAPREGDPMTGPSLVGLRNAFQAVCRRDPATAAEHAGLLKGAPGEYVRAFLSAMQAAIRDGEEIEVGHVLDLCSWVVERPIDEDTRPGSDEPFFGDFDKGWQWSWDVIAQIIREVCDRDIGDEYREVIWMVTEKLVQAPGGSNIVVDEKTFDPRTEDFATYALNATQGQAMRAVMAYAHWRAKRSGYEQGERLRGFEPFPEVRKVLERKLARDDPGGFAARAIYGWQFGLLNWLDRGWLKEHVPIIFDLRQIEDDSSRAYGWAAWNTFLMVNRPHKDFYSILREQFAYAVDQASKVVIEGSGGYDQPFHRLCEHLVVLYGRGDIDLDTDNELMKRLLTESYVPIRSYYSGGIWLNVMK